MSEVRVSRALISVADKTGLVELVQRLIALGVEIVSTGGTAQTLQRAGIAVSGIESLTGTGSMMGGRVKTLHPAIHASLLLRRDDDDDLRDASEHRIKLIDLLYVTLYPFADQVRSGADPDTCIEHIDIGGPTMLRAAAKNARWVTVCCDSDQMNRVLGEMERADGRTTLTLRRKLAAQVFAHTVRSEADIAAWYADQTDSEQPHLLLSGKESRILRYGENPHQAARLYLTGENAGIACGSLVQGKALSYNNIADLDAALALANEFPAAKSGAAAVIVKHCTPCGVALATTAARALAAARACDPVSAFGGVIAVNTALDGDAARVLVSAFTEAVTAPDADAEALEVLGTRKDLRVVLTRASGPSSSGVQVKSVSGGFLVQDRDGKCLDMKDLHIVSERDFTQDEIDDALFAYTVVKHARSNAIVFARRGAVIGIGSGQTSRIDAVRQAVARAGQHAREGFVVASDAFFPFPDGVIEAARAGASAVIQPGGSIRDDQVIAAADTAGIAMAFTHFRHFRH